MKSTYRNVFFFWFNSSTRTSRPTSTKLHLILTNSIKRLPSICIVTAFVSQPANRANLLLFALHQLNRTKLPLRATFCPQPNQTKKVCSVARQSKTKILHLCEKIAKEKSNGKMVRSGKLAFGREFREKFCFISSISFSFSLSFPLPPSYSVSRLSAAGGKLSVRDYFCPATSTKLSTTQCHGSRI